MRRFFRFGVILVGLLVLAGSVLFVWRISQFRQSVANLKADGQPVTLADLNNQVEVDEDAMTYLNRASKSLLAFEKEMWSDENVLSREVDQAMIERFHQLTTAYPDVYPLLEEMANARKFSGPPVESLDELMNQRLDSVNQFRSCLRVLVWKSRILAARQQPDQATLTALEGLRLARLLDDQGPMVTYLVGIACRSMAIAAIHDIVATHELTPVTRQLINDELELHDAMDGYEKALRGERAVGINMLRQNGMVHMALGGPDYLRFMQHEIDNSGLQEFERSEFSVDGGWLSSLVSAYGVQMVLPAASQLRSSQNILQSELRALRIINQLRATETASDENVTTNTLIQIAVRGVPAHMTIDPMSGDLLIIRNEEGWWKVYSVGFDGKDDGGDTRTLQDFALGGKRDKPQLPAKSDDH